MAITIIVTNAGRAALVNAENTGTNAVTITHLGITAAVFVPNAAQVALPGEIKRLPAVSGVVVADDQIHLTTSDVSPDAYSMRGLGFYLADGTLFAVYGQAGEILNKTSESMMLLAIDVAFADIDAAMIEFGDTDFILPPATTEVLGLVELATTAEAQAGSDATRVLTPLTGKQSVLGWLLSQDGSGSGLDADLLDGLHASAFAAAGHTHGTMAPQNANSVAITGGEISGVTLKNVQGAAGFGTSAPGGYLEVQHPGSGGEKSIVLSNTSWDRSLSAWAEADGYRLRSSGWSDNSARALMFSVGAIEAMRISPAGNVGIGGISPAAKLHVLGSGATFGITSTVNRGGGNCYQAFYDNVGRKAFLAFGAADDAFYVMNEVAEPIHLGTAATIRMTIGANGRVGVGTINPQAALDVRGDMWVRDPGNSYLRIYSAADVPSLSFCNAAGLRIVHNDATEIARFTDGGRFGLGTSAPDYLFEVAAPGVGAGVLQTAMQIKSKSDAANNAVELRFAPLTVGQTRTAIGARREGATANATLFFAAGGAERLALDGTGHLVPGSHGTQIFGWPTAAWKEGHFTDRIRIAGNDVWHVGNDGAGSGLDADLLDGQQGAYYLPAASYSAGDVLAKLLTVDGSGSGIDADLLDGHHGAAYVRVVDSNIVQNGGYRKYADGLIECWGFLDIPADSTGTFYLPVAHTSWVVPTISAYWPSGQTTSEHAVDWTSNNGVPPLSISFRNSDDRVVRVWIQTKGA